MQKKTILVTGGAGYIGSHCCKTLFDAGYLPITYDNLSRGHRYAVKWGPLIEGDLCDLAKLEETLARYKPLAVMHFAASSLVGESMQKPLVYYENNVQNSIRLIRAMVNQNIPYLVFSSTCATYGIPHKLPIEEEDPQSPISPYGKSKWMIEKILEDVSKTSSLHFASLRYFNAAGADNASFIGEHHVYETHLIPLLMQVASGDIPYLTIFGDDFPTKDGTAIRDYIHVLDIANAHLNALDWLFSKR